MSNSHDLNARAQELAMKLRCTFAEAKRELARRGGAVRARNLRMASTSVERIARQVAREERMGLR